MDFTENKSMEAAGEYLRSKREALGLTVEEISGITKIRPRYIEAVESGDFSQFTSQHLLRGYIKLIARTVKADEKKALDLLEQEIKSNFKDKHIEDIVGKRFKEEKEKSEKFKRRLLIIVFTGFFVIILSYIIIKVYKFVQTRPYIHIVFPFQSSIKSFVSVNKKPEKSKYIIKKQQPAMLYAAVLKGKVIKRTWVAVKIDGGNIETSMLEPGDTEAWKAKKRLRIKIGNAGGIILNYNGKNIGKPGIEKQVITLKFPPGT